MKVTRNILDNDKVIVHLEYTNQELQQVRQNSIDAAISRSLDKMAKNEELRRKRAEDNEKFRKQMEERNAKSQVQEYQMTDEDYENIFYWDDEEEYEEYEEYVEPETGEQKEKEPEPEKEKVPETK